MRSIEESGRARANGESLSREAEKLEALYLGLRELKGIDRNEFTSRYSTDPMELLSKAAREDDLLTFSESGQMKLTRKGLLFSDSLF
jgi:coproporphyrinogen III oxidase-like Fe-S oxidoreductase